MEDLLVLGERLDWVILEVSSNLDDSVILSVNIHVHIYITVQRLSLQETFKVYF